MLKGCWTAVCDEATCKKHYYSLTVHQERGSLAQEMIENGWYVTKDNACLCPYHKQQAGK